MEEVGSKSSGKSVPESGLELLSAHSLLKGCQSHVVHQHFSLKVSHWHLAKW